ncbi:hypothetical protein HK102_009647 [Quaeritorhiza haematococci]|nr:hypothetical protein HK102_009647 [Quaeritorhiza haematococci]
MDADSSLRLRCEELPFPILLQIVSELDARTLTNSTLLVSRSWFYATVETLWRRIPFRPEYERGRRKHLRPNGGGGRGSGSPKGGLGAVRWEKLGRTCEAVATFRGICNNGDGTHTATSTLDYGALVRRLEVSQVVTPQLRALAAQFWPQPARPMRTKDFEALFEEIEKQISRDGVDSSSGCLVTDFLARLGSAEAAAATNHPDSNTDEEDMINEGIIEALFYNRISLLEAHYTRKAVHPILRACYSLKHITLHDATNSGRWLDDSILDAVHTDKLVSLELLMDSRTGPFMNLLAFALNTGTQRAKLPLNKGVSDAAFVSLAHRAKQMHDLKIHLDHPPVNITPSGLAKVVSLGRLRQIEMSLPKGWLNAHPLPWLKKSLLDVFRESVGSQLESFRLLIVPRDLDEVGLSRLLQVARKSLKRLAIGHPNWVSLDRGGKPKSVPILNGLADSAPDKDDNQKDHWESREYRARQTQQQSLQQQQKQQQDDTIPLEKLSWAVPLGVSDLYTIHTVFQRTPNLTVLSVGLLPDESMVGALLRLALQTCPLVRKVWLSPERRGGWEPSTPSASTSVLGSSWWLADLATPVTDSCLKSLIQEGSKSLESLRIPLSGCTDEGLVYLHRLRDLDLTDCVRITGDGILSLVSGERRMETGPITSSLLSVDGVHTFAQLSDTTPERTRPTPDVADATAASTSVSSTQPCQDVKPWSKTLVLVNVNTITLEQLSALLHSGHLRSYSKFAVAGLSRSRFSQDEIQRWRTEVERIDPCKWPRKMRIAIQWRTLEYRVVELDGPSEDGTRLTSGRLRLQWRSQETGEWVSLKGLA